MMTMDRPEEKVLRYLTPEDIKAILNLSDRKIGDLLRSGEIPSVKIGKERRIDPADLQAFILRNKQGA